jgi:hypothetical protein
MFGQLISGSCDYLVEMRGVFRYLGLGHACVYWHEMLAKVICLMEYQSQSVAMLQLSTRLLCHASLQEFKVAALQALSPENACYKRQCHVIHQHTRLALYQPHVRQCQRVDDVLHHSRYPYIVVKECS